MNKGQKAIVSLLKNDADHGYTVQQIAEATNYSPKTVNSYANQLVQMNILIKARVKKNYFLINLT